MDYELVYILLPKLSEEEVKKKNQEIIKFLESKKARSIKEKFWGKRTLAYPIAHFSSGYYCQFNFSAEPSVISEIDNKLKLIEEIIRFLIVRQEEVGPVVPQKEPKETKMVSKVKISSKKEKKKPIKKADLDRKLDEILDKEITE